MEDKELGYNDKDIIQRHTVDKGFNAGAAFRELDQYINQLKARIELLEGVVIENLQKQDTGIILPDKPKIQLLK